MYQSVRMDCPSAEPDTSDTEHLRKGPAFGFSRQPASHTLGPGIKPNNLAFGIGRDDPVTDRLQRHAQIRAALPGRRRAVVCR